MTRARCVQRTGHWRGPDVFYVLRQIADDSGVNKQSLTDKKITSIVNQVNINQRLRVTVKKDLGNYTWINLMYSPRIA